jgi:hypothetical protein
MSIEEETMTSMGANRATVGAALAAIQTVTVAALAALALTPAALGQPPRGPGGPARGPQFENLPKTPTAVELPTLLAEVTGPGPMFNSAPSQAPGLDPAHFGYATREYFVSGTANGESYTARIVVRQPGDDDDFSGLVLAESMHGSGSAHGFEFTAAYLMDSGHAAVEIVTTSPAQFVEFNAARYANMKIEDGQANDILAQVGALVKSDKGPLAGLTVRKMVLFGTSMSAGTLIDYLPAHMAYRTPDMEHIYDGFLPTSNGSTIQEIDVPLIQMPTLLEIEANVPRRQDGDEPGKQYRLYEFAGIGHVDSRDNVRLIPNPCTQPLSTVPVQAYMAVGLYHLFRWVDEGIVPPRADRILLDRNIANDGTMAAVDVNGNAQGGIRTPYVDVPVAKYRASATAVDPVIPNASAYVAANGLQGAQIMCRLANYQEPFSAAQLRQLYGSKRDFARKLAARLDELEREGWSLPVYRELILSDAAAIEF